jgi:hypothetical protein
MLVRPLAEFTFLLISLVFMQDGGLAVMETWVVSIECSDIKLLRFTNSIRGHTLCRSFRGIYRGRDVRPNTGRNEIVSNFSRL